MSAKARPPPPPSIPPRKAAPATPADDPVPGSLLAVPTTRQKLELAAAAKRLRDEQIRARVVYYEPAQPTNAELDKITESVIAELHALQSARERPSVIAYAKDAPDPEIELIANLRRSLEKVLDPRRESFLRVKLEALSRRITTLYFAAELERDAPAGDARKTVTFPEQALYYALTTNRARIVEDLEGMSFERPALLDATLERLARLEKDLQVAFLSRTAPELEKLLEAFLDTFGSFFRERFRENLGELAWSVVRESAVVSHGATGARIPQQAFVRFRESFEREFLQELVLYAQEPLIGRVRETPGAFRRGTLAFVADPQVFSAVCSLMCDAFYVHLQAEGLLELPPGWRFAPEP